jgi:hypothetical protein
LTLGITPLASESSRHLEIGEKPGDTPRSLVGNRPRQGAAWAFAATQVLTTAYSAVNEPIFMGSDVTPYRAGDIVGQEELPSSQSPGGETELSPAESANRDRLALLAREYVAGQLSTEEEARLKIVSERVRRLIPRVTAQDFEELERIATELEQIGSEENSRHRRIVSL